MATKVIVSKEKLDNLANAINTKAETSGAKTLDELITTVDEFQGGVDTTDATATSSDILLGKTAYANEVKVEGTIPTYDGSSEGGVVDDTIDKLVEGTLTELKSNATIIRNYFFYQCYSLISIDLPNVLEIRRDAFNDCRYLTSVNLPNVKNIGQDAFYQCFSLKSIDLPNATYLYYSFHSCKKLKSVNVPKVEQLGYGVFSNCSVLTDISKFPNLQSINQKVFEYCSLLTDIYLGYNGIVSLASTNSFNNAGTTQGYINVHVRSEYADQYATATNWSALIGSDKIVIVGDYVDE